MACESYRSPPPPNHISISRQIRSIQIVPHTIRATPIRQFLAMKGIDDEIRRLSRTMPIRHDINKPANPSMMLSAQPSVEQTTLARSLPKS